MNEKQINEIMETNLDTVEDVIELVPEKKGVNFGKIGLAVVVTGAVAALGYKCYKLIKEKKAQKAQAAEYETVEDDDFDDAVTVQ